MEEEWPPTLQPSDGHDQLEAKKEDVAHVQAGPKETWHVPEAALGQEIAPQHIRAINYSEVQIQ